MQVVLLERVENLGIMGQVVDVKPGYARNYLLPQKKALRATKENLELFERQRKALEARNIKERQEAEVVAKNLEGASVILIRQASETGQLYGSVTARDIAEELVKERTNVNRSQIDIGQPIKVLGIHTITLILHPEVRVPLLVNIAQSVEEAKMKADALAKSKAKTEEESAL